jgi:hypothetical protein
MEKDFKQGRRNGTQRHGKGFQTRFQTLQRAQDVREPLPSIWKCGVIKEQHLYSDAGSCRWTYFPIRDTALTVTDGSGIPGVHPGAVRRRLVATTFDAKSVQAVPRSVHGNLHDPRCTHGWDIP